MLQAVTQLATVTIGTYQAAPAAPALAQIDPTCAVNTGAITLAPNAGSLYSLDGGTYAAYPAGGYHRSCCQDQHILSLNKMLQVVTQLMQP